MKLDPLVVGLVLLAALLHASWNAVVKADRDPLASFGLVMITGSVMALAALPFVEPPAPAAWPYLAASTAIHGFYYFFLLRAYAHGDLSHVYPIARGLGPLLVALFSGRLAGEALAWHEAGGVVIVSIGIFGLALGSGLAFALAWRPTVFALMTGITIGAYTVTDGLGARASSDALGYIAWLNILEGPWLMLIALWRRGAVIVPYLREYAWRGIAGGVVATISYGIAIWALSLGAMAHVAALRETSVLFATLIGTMILGERFGPRRIAAAALVVAGLLAMNLPLG
jgi:drug/metabolite transporter (DMT)-like permease